MAVSKKLRYYAMHVDAFDEDERVIGMDLSAVGLYILALHEAWKRGSIPDDPIELSRLIRRKASDVKKSWDQVRKCWIPSGEPGRLVNKRQEKERAIAEGRVSQAKRAATVRWDAGAHAPAYSASHAATDSEASPPAMLRASNSNSYILSKKEELREKQKNWFISELWPICWRKVDRAQALKVFCNKALDEETKDRIITAANAAAVVYLKREPEMRPHMATWLNKERFNDDLPEDDRVIQKGINWDEVAQA